MGASLDSIWNEVVRINDKLDELPGIIEINAHQIHVVSLDELSESMGLLMAGEIRVGNQQVPGDTFSGMRIRFPPMAYPQGSTADSDLYNLVGVDADTLMVGIGASDGVLYAGQGDVWLDEAGVNIRAGVFGRNVIGWWSTITGTDDYAAMIRVHADSNYDAAGHDRFIARFLAGADLNDTGGGEVMYTEVELQAYAVDSSGGGAVMGKTNFEIVHTNSDAAGSDAWEILNFEHQPNLASAANKPWAIERTGAGYWYWFEGVYDTTSFIAQTINSPVGGGGIFTEYGDPVQWSISAGAEESTDDTTYGDFAIYNDRSRGAAGEKIWGLSRYGMLLPFVASAGRTPDNSFLSVWPDTNGNLRLTDSGGINWNIPKIQIESTTVAISNDSTQTELWTVSIPANHLTAGGAIEVTVFGHLDNQSGATANMFHHLNWGDTAISDSGKSITTGTTRGVLYHVWLKSEGISTGQNLTGILDETATVGWFGSTFDQDAGAAQTLSMDFAWSSANASLTYTFEGAEIEFLRGS